MEHKGISSVTTEKKRANIKSPLTWELVKKAPDYTVLGFGAPLLAEYSGTSL